MKTVPSLLLAACLVGATLVGSPLAQPGGGGPGGGGPGGGGPGGGGPGGGGPSPTFGFEICNTSSIPAIFVAVVSLSGQQFRAQGWWKVPRGSQNQCTKIGDFQRPGIFAHASDPQGDTWGNADIQLCTNMKSSFDYTWDGKTRNCGAGETVAPYKKIEVAPDKTGMTWTLHD